MELKPVAAGAVADYLPGGQIGGGERWAPVVAEIEAHPDGELAPVLSTPLMITLARKVYESGLQLARAARPVWPRSQPHRRQYEATAVAC